MDNCYVCGNDSSFTMHRKGIERELCLCTDCMEVIATEYEEGKAPEKEAAATTTADADTDECGD